MTVRDVVNSQCFIDSAQLMAKYVPDVKVRIILLNNAFQSVDKIKESVCMQ